MVSVFIEISIELNLVELNQIILDSIELNKTWLNSNSFQLNYVHNFVELNLT
jgi:hypothetical protein